MIPSSINSTRDETSFHKPPNSELDEFDAYADYHEAANDFDQPPTTTESTEKAGDANGSTSPAEAATLLSHDSADQSMSTIHSEKGDGDPDPTSQELDNIALKLSRMSVWDQPGNSPPDHKTTNPRQNGLKAIQASRNSMLTELERGERRRKIASGKKSTVKKSTLP
jgi:hypothetical protein